MKDGVDESDFPYDCITSSTGEVIGLPPEIRFPGAKFVKDEPKPKEEDIVGSCSFNQTLRTFL